MYAVSYFNGTDVLGETFCCPTYSKEYFLEKKAQGFPCAYLVKEEDDEDVGLIDSHRYEELEQAYEKRFNGK